MKLLHIVENWSQSLRQCWIAGVPRWRRHGSGTQASGQLSFEDNVSLDQNEPDDKIQREEQGQGWIKLCGLDITWQQPKCCVTASGEEKKYRACAQTSCAAHAQSSDSRLSFFRAWNNFQGLSLNKTPVWPQKNKYILIGRMSGLPTEKIQQNAENFGERRCYVRIEIRK